MVITLDEFYVNWVSVRLVPNLHSTQVMDKTKGGSLWKRGKPHVARNFLQHLGFLLHQ